MVGECPNCTMPCWQAWRLRHGVLITAMLLLSGLGAWQAAAQAEVTVSVAPDAVGKESAEIALRAAAALTAAREDPTITRLSLGGTAILGSDYQGVRASPEITASSATTFGDTVIALTVIDDPYYERSGADAFEIIEVKGSKTDGLQIQSSELKVNDKHDALVLRVTGESKQEANGPLTFTLTLDAVSTSDIELTYATADGTATAGGGL